MDRSAIARIVQAVIRAEIERLRARARGGLASGQWHDDTRLGDDGLGIDSLETLGILAALADMFAIDDDMLGDRPPTRFGDLVALVASATSGGDATVIVATSGSTGMPKRCPHALADLLAEAACFAEATRGRRRVVAMVPAHHLYGLVWTALVPEALGVPVVDVQTGAKLALEPGDLVVAVPDQWRIVPRLVGRMPDDVWGVSSGAPLSSAAEAAAIDGGVARLIDIYGASELGGIAVRVAPACDYRLLPRWRLDRNGDAVVDTQDRRHALPDKIVRTGERTIRLAGRRDGAIQVGGYNVWPQRVVGLLQRTPGVFDAAVRVGDDGRLKAFVVPDDGVDIDEVGRSIDRLIVALSTAERPTRYSFGSALPRTSLGKLKDWT